MALNKLQLMEKFWGCVPITFAKTASAVAHSSVDAQKFSVNFSGCQAWLLLYARFILPFRYFSSKHWRLSVSIYINKLVAIVDSIEMDSMRKKTDNDIMRENFCSILWLNRNTEMNRNKTRHDTKNRKSMEETCEC